MQIEGPEDVEGLKAIGRIVGLTRDAMLEAVEPGISTGDLDQIARRMFKEHGARSAPQLAYNFPGATCLSVNDEAAHGIPSPSRVLQSGDLINIDVSAELNGYWADCGASAPVGAVDNRSHELLRATRTAQREAMNAARAGRAMRNVARVVQEHARRAGFTVIANLCGHGVGRSIHEEPQVPSVVEQGNSIILKEGMVLAIEPFLSMGGTMAYEADDGWTLCTDDGSLVAQFEHTIIVTKEDPIILTAT